VAEANYIAQREDWIRRELDDCEADETTEGWQQLEDDYDEVYELWNNHYQDEYEWHISQDHSSHHIEFIQTMNELKNILKSQIDALLSKTIYKMVHTHAVTAMETYLGDSLKSAALSNSGYIERAAKNLDELTKRKFTLEQILAHEDGIKKIVLEQLTKYLYHDIPKVMMIYSAVLGLTLNYDYDRLCKITKIRHDLVHRNGKDWTSQGLLDTF